MRGNNRRKGALLKTEITFYLDHLLVYCGDHDDHNDQDDYDDHDYQDDYDDHDDHDDHRTMGERELY